MSVSNAQYAALLQRINELENDNRFRSHVAALRQEIADMNKDFYYEVSAGRIPGMTSGFIVGRNPDVNATTTETMWDFGGKYTYLTANTQLYASSSSASDTAVTLLLSGLDDSYNSISLTVTLNGQSQVALSAATAFRIFTVVVTGSTSPLGGVYIAETDTLTAGVPNTASKVKAKIALSTDKDNVVIDGGTDFASSNITHLGLYTVPAGKRMTLTKIVAGAGKNDDIKLDGKIRLLGGVWLDRNPVSLYQTNQVLPFEPPLVLAEKTDIEFTAIAGSVNSLAQVQALFILEDI